MPIIPIPHRRSASELIDPQPQFVVTDAAAVLGCLVELGAGHGGFGVEADVVGAGLAVVAADAMGVEGGVVAGTDTDELGLLSAEASGGAVGTEGVVVGVGHC